VRPRQIRTVLGRRTLLAVALLAVAPLALVVVAAAIVALILVGAVVGAVVLVVAAFGAVAPIAVPPLAVAVPELVIAAGSSVAGVALFGSAHRASIASRSSEAVQSL
jgi:hypothetical protein